MAGRYLSSSCFSVNFEFDVVFQLKIEDVVPGFAFASGGFLIYKRNVNKYHGKYLLA